MKDIGNGKKKYLLKYFDGQFMTAEDQRIRSAIPFIERRLEYSMPIDTIDVPDVLALIDYIKVNPNRSCSAEEVRSIVEAVKSFLLEGIENMEHHQRFISERGRNDAKGS